MPSAPPREPAASTGPRRRILFATGNRGKLAEGERLLAPAGVDLVSLDALGIRLEVEEDAPDYRGNALVKARAAARLGGLAALGDDSGLEVEALDGRPGVRSARYGGAGLDDAGRNRLLLEELREVPPERRQARFVCVLVLVAADGSELAEARGTCEGWIAAAPRGGLGFGYDPLFELPDRARTFAELDAAEKDARSHRGRAFRALAAMLAGAGPGT